MGMVLDKRNFLLPCWFEGSLRSSQTVPFFALKFFLKANPPFPVAGNERTSFMTLNFQGEELKIQMRKVKSAVTIHFRRMHTTVAAPIFR